MRAPWRWLAGIASPTFVFEGMEQPSNLAALQALDKRPHPDLVHFYPVAGVSHFSILQPVTRLLARKIIEDNTGAKTGVAFASGEIERAVQPQ